MSRSYFSRPRILVSIFGSLVLLALSVPGASAQVPSMIVFFGLNAVRLPLPILPATPPSTPVAVTVSAPRPMARLVGTTAHTDLPRPFRPRIVLIDANHAPSKPATPIAPVPEPAAAAATAQEQRALQLINAERAKKNLPALVLDPLLLRVARMHSLNMATRDFFNHVSPDGKTATERCKAQGLRGWHALGENIAYNQGYADPVAFAVERWMLSPLHRENMLSPMWTSSAIGIATAADGRIFFTELFLAR